MTRVTRLSAAARDPRGFTVTELLVVMLILSTVIGGVVTLFVSGMKAEVDMNKRFQAQSNARLALERMRREAHCASAATPAGATTAVRLTIPGGCTPTVAATADVVWCTRGSGSRFQLFRVAGTTCTGGTHLADFLTLDRAFDYTAGTGSSLSRLRVEFRVDLDPADTNRAYALVDELVLRNDVR